jgi:broad specificity phosphatase PhoE
LTATLLLVRHGQTDAVGAWMAGYLAVPLNDAGRVQAQRLVERLGPARIDAIYSSPLDRARQTAEPLAVARGLPVVDLPEVTEFNMGEWDGQRFGDLEANDERWRRFNHLRSLTRAPGGELMVEVQARIAGALVRVVDAHPGGTVAVFSHADPIRAAVLYFAGMPIDFFSRLDVAPASVSAIAFRPGGPALVTLNSTGAYA